MALKTLDAFLEEYTKDSVAYVKPFLSVYVNHIFQRLCENMVTVTDEDIKVLIEAMLGSVEDFLSKGESHWKHEQSITINIQSLIGKEIGWSAVYKLMRNLQNMQGNFVSVSNIYIGTKNEYILISSNGVYIPYLQKIEQLMKLKDDASFSKLQISFGDILDYIKIPQYVGDVLSFM